MLRAVDLLRQGRDEELWQMCCGFLKLSIGEFMNIQRRLLEEQLEMLGNCPLGEKITRGARPKTVEEFREKVPLTIYKDYCPELQEKSEEVLPVKPAFWSRSSGRSDDYPFKLVPMMPLYAETLSTSLYGIGMLSCGRWWGDTSRIPDKIKLLYGVAPRPYIGGTFADLLRRQSPLMYLPPLEDAEVLSFEERIGKGFQQAMSEGLDYFFGLSLVLVKVGEKLSESSKKIDVRQYLGNPKALLRLARGLIRSRMAGRTKLLPKDLWSLKGIIGSGVDSWIYKDKVNEFWGVEPLDLYACTEGGVIATQTWDRDGMTFIPQLNFLEFIPEDERDKLQMDRTYIPRTFLLNEVEAGKTYELVITNFHGGVMTRYRIGDMVRITSLRNEKLGIDIPQMAFERRADDVLNFMVIRLNERQIWQALENSGYAYEDWAAYKIPGSSIMNLLIEPKEGQTVDEVALAEVIQKEVIALGRSSYIDSGIQEDWRDSLDFKVQVSFLPQGTFARYTVQKQAEGADLAHIKPPHVNPSEEVLSVLTAGTEEETIIVTKTRTRAEIESKGKKAAV